MNPKQLVEIARSFSYKLNVGNYESRDFFCSQKAEVPFEDAEETSQALYHFCKSEVIKAVNTYLKEMQLPRSEYQLPTRNGKQVNLGDGQGVFPEKDVYTATDYKGGKKKVNKEENTLDPY